MKLLLGLTLLCWLPTAGAQVQKPDSPAGTITAPSKESASGVVNSQAKRKKAKGKAITFCDCDPTTGPTRIVITRGVGESVQTEVLEKK